MSYYEDLVMKSQMNYSRYYRLYASGQTIHPLTDKKPLPYEEQIQRFVREIKEADCVIIGGASGLSAAGGGDFYYEATPSFHQHFGKFARHYGFRGAFDGSFYQYDTPEEKWAFLSTFLHTTQNAPLRKPYLDLKEILRKKDAFVLTTNQDTQAVKAFPEHMVAEIQGDHRFFQCSQCCTDDTWDAIEPVKAMMQAQGEGITIPSELVPRCPHCGAEAFPWVRGYGNFLQGKKYEEEYEKISRYLLEHKDKKILFVELGVGRMTPMFIQEPFWELTETLPHASYISVNDKFDYVPKSIEEKGMAIVGNIATVLEDVKAALAKEEGNA